MKKQNIVKKLNNQLSEVILMLLRSNKCQPGVDCYYLGHHKCASNWMRRFIHYICHEIYYNYQVYGGSSKRSISSRFRKNTFFLYVNSTMEDMKAVSNQAKGFHLIRDPRDVLVSDYFSRRKTHKVVDTLHKIEMRKYLQEHSIEEGLLYMLDHCTFFKQIQGWKISERENILDIKYEDLILDEKKVFKKILNHMSISITDKKLDDIISKCTFKTLSGGREPGQEDTNSHYRKGISGDWKNYIKKGSHIYDAFYKRYEHIINNLGYDV